MVEWENSKESHAYIHPGMGTPFNWWVEFVFFLFSNVPKICTCKVAQLIKTVLGVCVNVSTVPYYLRKTKTTLFTFPPKEEL